MSHSRLTRSYSASQRIDHPLYPLASGQRGDFFIFFFFSLFIRWLADKEGEQRSAFGWVHTGYNWNYIT